MTLAGADGLTVQVTSVKLTWMKAQDLKRGRKWRISSPPDRTILISRSTAPRARCNFGDGQFGRIPVANPADPNANIVARVYRFGGGKHGKCRDRSVKALQTFVDGVDSVTNLQPTLGGTDEESLRRTPSCVRPRHSRARTVR